MPEPFGRPFLCGLCALWLTSSEPTLAIAQGQSLVRGDVVLADDRTPAPGVIVEVTDATNALVVRSLTTIRGTFSITLPRSGRYGARVLRIGFRPTIVAAFDVSAGAPNTLHIVLTSEPIHLAEVRVAGEDACRIRADSGKLVAQVWEETRKALASTQLSEFGQQLSAAGLSYRSMLDVAGNVVHWQSYSVIRTAGARPFMSPPADSLARFGYASTDTGGTINYYGPDAVALISDDFAAGHCFRLFPGPAEHPAWIGVAFRPVRDRRGITDIAGTFWVDRTSAELRYLDYRYTNVPVAVERLGAGGRIEFLRLSSGDWLTNRWNIRAPSIIDRRTVTQDVRSPRGQRESRSQVITTPGLNISGGEALSVERDGEELYRNKGVSWNAVLTSRGEVGSTDATIEFPTNGYFAPADSSGRVHLDHVQPGTHLALLSTWAMRTAGLPAQRRTIEITADSLDIESLFRLPTDEELLVERCGSDAAARQGALLVGTLADSRHAPIESDTLFVRWLSDAARAGVTADRWRADSLRLVAGDPPRENADGWVVTGSFGRWYLCGVPRSATVRVTSEPARAKATLLLQVHVGPTDKIVGLELTSTRTP